jgi:long-chain acyl-CoA synthetase
VLEGYGLTETSPVATFNQRGFEPRPGTVGKPIWGVEVEVARAEVDDRIELLPAGELGEIVVRGHNIFAGYLNKPDETAAAIVDGWFRTGDLGTKDADDYVTIVDRKKDMVIRGGYNIYPREVEEALLAHPSVAEACVVGRPDREWGEVVVAFVVARGAAPPSSELDRACLERIARFKRPREYHFVAQLPKNHNGKVVKAELRDRLQRSAVAAGFPPTRE